MRSVREIHVNGKWLAQSLTGTQRYASEMTEAVAKTRRVNILLHVPKGTELPEWVTRYGIRVRSAPVRGIVFEQVYLPLASAGRLLVNFAGPAPLFKRRQVVTMHDATPFRYPQTFRRTFVAFYYVMYFILGRTAKQLVTVSDFSARELESVLGIREDKFVVAPCAADALSDTTPRRPDLAVPEHFYLVVGTQAVHKNLRGPIAAVADSGRDVVVVGLSGNRQVFSSTQALDQHAIVPGRLDDAELVWLYKHARALIFPSKYEGFGLPPLEAQSLGTPVITSTAASLPEVCGDGALYFDPDEPESLINRLDELESQPGLAKDLRRLGAQNCRRFSWSLSADKLLSRLGVS